MRAYLMWPVLLMGLSSGRMTSCRASSSPYLCVHCSRFSPSVRPVTVMLFPSIILFLSRNARISVNQKQKKIFQIYGPRRGNAQAYWECLRACKRLP